MKQKIKRILLAILQIGLVFLAIYFSIQIIGLILKLGLILIDLVPELVVFVYFPITFFKNVSRLVFSQKEKRKIFKKYGKKNENLKTYALSLLEGTQLCYDENGNKVYTEELIVPCEEQMVRFQPPFKDRKNFEYTYFSELLKKYEEKKRLVAVTLEKEKLLTYKRELINLSFELQSNAYFNNPYLNGRYTSLESIYENKEQNIRRIIKRKK